MHRKAEIAFKKDSNRTSAIVVGVLFIIATTAPILSSFFWTPADERGFLIAASSNATGLETGATLELIMAIAIAGIAILLYPILKEYNPVLSIGYLTVRIIEATIFIVIAVQSLLLLITLSREFVEIGSPDLPHYQTLGFLILAVHDWAYVLGGKIIFSLSAIALNYILYRSKLIPRSISIWGLLGATLLLVGGLLNLFSLLPDTSVLTILVFLPIALQEMVFAGWLIVRGFNPIG